MSGGAPSIPDGIEPVTGWRYWGCDSGWLTSIIRFSTWPAGHAVRARCSHAELHGGLIPHEDCTCGIYAVGGLDVLKRVAEVEEGATVVVGTVAVWGRIVPGEWGWRGEFGYPSRLWVVGETVTDGRPEDLAARLERAYRVTATVCEASWALPAEVRPPPGADTRALAAEAWDLAHGLDRLAAATRRSGSAFEEELRRFFRAGLGRSLGAAGGSAARVPGADAGPDPSPR